MRYKFILPLVGAIFSMSNLVANEPNENPLIKSRVIRGSAEFSKWFASANAGAQFFIGDHDKQESLGKRITPNFEVSVGKWLNPSFGVRAGLNGYKIKGLTKGGALATSKDMVIGAPHYLYDQEFNYLNFHADVLFHWSNDAYDVDLDRLYNIIPYAGLGIMTATNHQKGTHFSPNFGVIQTLRLTDKLDMNLDVKGNIVGDKFDGEVGGNKFEGRMSATLGITYNFR